MTFHVGMKVVCVDDDFGKNHNGELLPKLNQIYTIRTIEENPFKPGNFGIRLFEIVNHMFEYDDDFAECRFSALQFRPVVERKTDISIFTKMLNSVRESA